MDFLFVFSGLSIMWLFMFKIEWLHKGGIAFWAIFIYSLLLFGASVILHNGDIGTSKSINALKMPLISYAVFRGLNFAFLRMYKREPENTFWSFQKKPIQDVIFSILFWFLGVGLPFMIL